MSKYFYKDKKTGKLKKYIGNVIERDGKFYGILVDHKIEYSEKKLNPVSSHQSIDSQSSYLVWKDKYGIEHELTENDDIKDNKVIYKNEYSLKITYHPEILEEHYFVRKDNKEKFTGEIIEKDEKIYGKLK